MENKRRVEIIDSAKLKKGVCLASDIGIKQSISYYNCSYHACIVNFICVVVAPAGTLDARGLTKLQVFRLRRMAILALALQTPVVVLLTFLHWSA